MQLIQKPRVIGSAIVPVVNIIASALIMISILPALILINPIVAISSFVGFGFVYFIIILMTRKRLSENASSIARDSDLVVKLCKRVLEGYGHNYRWQPRGILQRV